MTEELKRSLVLREVDALFAEPKSWIKGALFGKQVDDPRIGYARTNGTTGTRYSLNTEGHSVTVKEADCFCFLGAVAKVLDNHGVAPPVAYFADGTPLDDWLVEAAKYGYEYASCGYSRRGIPKYFEDEDKDQLPASTAYTVNDDMTSSFDELKADIACAIKLAEEEENEDSA